MLVLGERDPECFAAQTFEELLTGVPTGDESPRERTDACLVIASLTKSTTSSDTPRRRARETIGLMTPADGNDAHDRSELLLQ